MAKSLAAVPQAATDESIKTTEIAASLLASHSWANCHNRDECPWSQEGHDHWWLYEQPESEIPPHSWAECKLKGYDQTCPYSESGHGQRIDELRFRLLTKLVKEGQQLLAETNRASLQQSQLTAQLHAIISQHTAYAASVTEELLKCAAPPKTSFTRASTVASSEVK